MILFAKVQYVDRADRQIKDRHLYLDTNTLDPVTKAAVEFIAKKTFPPEPEILKYRHLFMEDRDALQPEKFDSFVVFMMPGIEDETGKELSMDEVGAILTGEPNVRHIPNGVKQHDIDFMLSSPPPLPIAEVNLQPEEVRLFGFFVRDLNELCRSSFLKEQSFGKLEGNSSFIQLSPASNYTLKTSITDEEIRSFVMIFRRLYMTGDWDPASFTKIIPIFVTAMDGHPHGKLVEGISVEYQNQLNSIPDLYSFMKPNTCTFRAKDLIDVFLYTQYAHQPNHGRQNEFGRYLKELHGQRQFFTWLFLNQIRERSWEITRAGKIISTWFQRYCEHHGITPNILQSLLDDHPGFGTIEKQKDLEARLFQEKAEELARSLWEQAGRPSGGYTDFLANARELLARRLGG